MKKLLFKLSKKGIIFVLTLLMAFSCFSLLGILQVSADATLLKTNGNGLKNDVGAWFTTYNVNAFWGENGRFSDPAQVAVGYKALRSDGTYGLPDSSSDDEIDFQIGKMAEAGIDFIVFDLTNGGLTDSFGAGMDSSLAFILANAKKTCERIAVWNTQHRWQVKYAVAIGTYYNLRRSCTEPDCPSSDPYYSSIGKAIELQAQAVKEQFIDNEIYGEYYYCIDDQPLLILHNLDEGNPISSANGYDDYTGDKTYSSKFSLKPSYSTATAGAYGWRTVGAVANDNDCGAVADDEVMLVCPGQTNYANGNTAHQVLREDGAHYQANWDAVIENSPRIVMIASINDYMEDTAIWPTDTTDCEAEEHWTTNNVEDPYKYWNMTVDYIKQLRSDSGDIIFNDNIFSDAVFSSSGTVAAGDIGLLNDGVKRWSGETPSIAVLYNANGIAYYQADLKKAEMISTVRYCIFNGAANERARDIAVDLQLTDGRWIRVAERHNIQYDNSTWVSVVEKGVQTVFIPFNFDATECIAVRITANRQRTRDIENNPTGSYNFRSVELEAYCDKNQTNLTGANPDEDSAYNIPYYVSENYALGKTVTAISGMSYGSGNDASTMAGKLAILTDGVKTSSDTFFFDTQASPSNLSNIYFNIDLEESRIINCVTTTILVEAGPKRDSRDMAVDVKMPNGIWMRVAEQHNMDYAAASTKYITFDFAFEPVEAIEVRLTFNRTNISNYNNNRVLVSPSEIEVYYDLNKEISGVDTVESNDPTYMPVSVSDNLAANATFSANSIIPSCPLSNLTDGNKQYNNGDVPDAATSYNSEGYAYFQADFNETVYVSKLKMFCSNLEAEKRAGDIVVDVLLQNGNWKRVAERHNLQYGTTNEWTIENLASGGIATSYSFNFDAIECAAIRISANSARNSGNFRVREIELYCDWGQGSLTGTAKDANTLYNIPVPASDNYALISTITSSNSNAWMAENYPISRLIDGNKAVGDSCGIIKSATTLETITLTFDNKHIVNELNIYYSRDERDLSPFDYAVEAMVNGNWERVAEKHNVSDVSVMNLSFKFEAVEADAVRLIANRVTNTLSNNFRLVEIETYYNPNTESTEYDGIEKYDVNGDIVLDSSDLIYLTKCLLGVIDSPADVNEDGVTNIIDLISMKKHLIQ